MRKAGVYLITNEVTGKNYVGSSSSLWHRFLSHRSKYRKGYMNNSDMGRDLKLGHTFRFTVIEYTDNYREQELWWIEFFNTGKPHGYNQRGFTKSTF